MLSAFAGKIYKAKMFRTPPRTRKNQVFKVDYSSSHKLVDCIDGKSNDETPSAEKVTVPNPQDGSKICLVVNNVLSENECSRIIQRSEDAGYKQALVNIGVGEVLDSDYRNSDRCIIDDVEFAQILFERIKPFLPASMYGNWKLCGLNERMRILKYGKGNFFAPHSDGCYYPNVRKRSFHTVMIYLNEGEGLDFSGGTTNFVAGHFDESKSEVVPKTGSVLVFDHVLRHEGAKVSSGRKYAIRSDVMYECDEH